MFGTIRKHQTWLWGLVIFFTIIGMVTYFGGPGSQPGRGRGDGDYGSMDGVKITQNEFEQAEREAILDIVLNRPPDSKVTLTQEETYQRLFLVRKLKQYNIDVDNRSVAQAADRVLRNKGMSIDDLLKIASQQMRVRDTDFERFMRHNLALEQLRSMVGLSGDLVTPIEVQMLYQDTFQELATFAVFFSGTNYFAQVTPPSSEALAAYYTKHIPVYRIPDRVQVSYARFDISNYLSQVQAAYTNVADEVDYNMSHLGSNYLHFGKTPEEARKKIGEDLLHRRATEEAHRKANDFATLVFSVEPLRAENLTTLARSNGMPVGVTLPFDEQNGPTEFDGGFNFTRAAFKLTPEEPVSEQVLVGSNAVFIIALAKKIPSEVPTLDSIRARVLGEYKEEQAVGLAKLAGIQFSQAVTNGLAHGKSFEAICAEAKVKPVALPPFSRATQELPQLGDHVPLYQFQQIAFNTRPGSASDFMSVLDGGYVVYVQKRLPLDPAQMKKDLPIFFDQVRRGRRHDAFRAWFYRELDKSMPGLLRPKQPAAPPGQAKS